MAKSGLMLPVSIEPTLYFTTMFTLPLGDEQSLTAKPFYFLVTPNVLVKY